MGNCFCCSSNEPIVRVALKLPNGAAGIRYDSGAFVPITNMNEWLRDLYADHSWTNWLVYNDETGGLNVQGHTKGHCKGILAWNNESISWLVHSVPNFPRVFIGHAVSEIEAGEMIYGQSFCYTEYSFTKQRLDQILIQLTNMEPHIFIKRMEGELPKPEKKKMVYEMVLSDSICHLSKSSHHIIDLYSQYLCQKDEGVWTVETWKRGSKIKSSCGNLREIQSLKYGNTEYKETQDHSKWAASNEYCFIGDLNRMESQTKRGGGGILIRDKAMARAFRGLVDEVIIKFES